MKNVVSIGTRLTNKAMEGDYQEVSLLQGEIRALINELGNVAVLKMEYLSEWIADNLTSEEYSVLVTLAEQKTASLELQLKHLKEKVNDLTELMNLKWGSNFKGL